MSRFETAPDGTFRKIRGWLVFPAFVHPVFTVYTCVESAIALASTLSLGTPESTRRLHILLIAFLALEAVGWIACFILALRLNRWFPRAYIALVLVSTFAVIASPDLLAAQFNARSEIDYYLGVLGSAGVAIIWIWYMLVSKRVAATFYGVPFPKDDATEINA